jgi:three-Cys-motif partner protein
MGRKGRPLGTRQTIIITDYVQIASATRRKYKHCGFIDVFCGPGQSQIRETGELIDGSPVAAYKQARAGHPFSSVHISDADKDLLSSAETRLRNAGAPVVATKGPASVALPRMVNQLSSSGLHLALLDPHNLGALSFDLFECLSRLQRIDVIVHVSLSDLQRNVDRYTSAAHEQFDKFAPDWRNHVNTEMNQAALRAAIMKYWTDRVVSLGLPRARHCEQRARTTNASIGLFFSPSISFLTRSGKKLPPYRKLQRSIFEAMPLEVIRSFDSGITVPYGPIFDDIRRSNGFTDLRGRPDLAEKIVEGSSSRALRELLVRVARERSYFSLGCDLGRYAEDEQPPNQRKVSGGYLQIASTNYAEASTDQYDVFCEAFGRELSRHVRKRRWKINLRGTYVQFNLPGEFVCECALDVDVVLCGRNDAPEV